MIEYLTIIMAFLNIFDCIVSVYFYMILDGFRKKVSVLLFFAHLLFAMFFTYKLIF